MHEADTERASVPSSTPQTADHTDSQGSDLTDLLAKWAPTLSPSAVLSRLEEDTELLTPVDDARNLDAPENDLDEDSIGGSPESWQNQFNSPIPDYTRQIALAKAIEAGLLAREMLDDPARLEHFPVAAKDLARIHQEGLDAFEEMFTGNLRLVLHWAHKSPPQLDVQDKFQHGTFGLRRAIERWDWRRGYTFATYATWHIRQAIFRGIGNEGSSIRLPIHVLDSFRADTPPPAGASTRNAQKILAGILSIDYLAEELEMTPDTFDYRCTDPSDFIDERVTNELEVGFRLQILSERESQIIRLRVGMDGPIQTLDEIGKELGVTRERVRQIESVALARLRSELWGTYSVLEGDRSAFRQAAQETPNVQAALKALSNPRHIARVAKEFGTTTSELHAALKRLRDSVQ